MSLPAQMKDSRECAEIAEKKMGFTRRREDAKKERGADRPFIISNVSPGPDEAARKPLRGKHYIFASSRLRVNQKSPRRCANPLQNRHAIPSPL